MTIYYPAEWQAAGGPPHEGHCQFVNATLVTKCDEDVDCVIITLHDGKWMVIDPADGAILMDCPYTNHLAPATYLADYIRWSTDVQAAIDRHPASYHKKKGKTDG